VLVGMLGLLLRRLLVYRLIRYRGAWLVAGLLCCCLTATVSRAIQSRAQVATSGTIGSCSESRESTGQPASYTFRLREMPQVMWSLDASAFSPRLPDRLCLTPSVTLLYETDALFGRGTVDRIEIGDLLTGATRVFTAEADRDFDRNKWMSLALYGGGLGALSLALLFIALFWPQTGGVVLGGRYRTITPSADRRGRLE
jgi:hypothetical protein